MDDLYFEIKSDDNFVRIDFLDKEDYLSNRISDYSWLRVEIATKAGRFSSNYIVDIYKVNLFSFYEKFAMLYENLNGSAIFEDSENCFKINITGDGMGHFTVAVEDIDYSQEDAVLKYSINFDQTQLPEMINQLNKIINKYSAV